MATGFDDLRVLRMAEEVADGIWKDVTEWNEFLQDSVPLFSEKEVAYLSSLSWGDDQ